MAPHSQPSVAPPLAAHPGKAPLPSEMGQNLRGALGPPSAFQPSPRAGWELQQHPQPIGCHGQGHLPLDQIAQSSIQPGLRHCQGRGSHSFSGQPVPVPHHPHREEFLPYISSKPALFQLEAITPCPITTCPCKQALSSFLVGLLQVLEGCDKVSLEPSLLQAKHPQLSQPLLTGEVFHPSDHFRDRSNRSLYFLG